MGQRHLLEFVQSIMLQGIEVRISTLWNSESLSDFVALRRLIVKTPQSQSRSTNQDALFIIYVCTAQESS